MMGLIIMKKLLLVAIVTIGTVHQTSPMLFRTTSTKKLVPVFPSGENTPHRDRQQNQEIDQEKFFNGNTELRRVIQYSPKDEDGNSIKGEVKGQEMTRRINISVIDSSIMKTWCDAFKRNSKKPGMWTQDVQKEKKIEEVVYYYVDKDKVQNIAHNLKVEAAEFRKKSAPELAMLGLSYANSDYEFCQRVDDLQNEWNAWQQDPVKFNSIFAIKVTYKKPVDSLKSFIMFKQSPYCKHIDNQDRSVTIKLAHALENNMYHESLRSLQILQAAIERDLRDQFYFQRLWNRGKRQNSQQALARVSDEIALFKNQDEKNEVKQLTYRDVFIRSSMPRTMVEKVKAARE